MTDRIVNKLRRRPGMLRSWPWGMPVCFVITRYLIEKMAAQRPSQSKETLRILRTLSNHSAHHRLRLFTWLYVSLALAGAVPSPPRSRGCSGRLPLQPRDRAGHDAGVTWTSRWFRRLGVRPLAVTMIFFLEGIISPSRSTSPFPVQRWVSVALVGRERSLPVPSAVAYQRLYK